MLWVPEVPCCLCRATHDTLFVEWFWRRAACEVETRLYIALKCGMSELRGDVLVSLRPLYAYALFSCATELALSSS